MLAQRPAFASEGRRIVICDYNALLLSVTGLLRMSGYCVFQAHNGLAAQELCIALPEISLLVLNTYGTGIDVGDLVRRVRAAKPDCAVLHIGAEIPAGLPADVPTLPEPFTPDDLLLAVKALIPAVAPSTPPALIGEDACTMPWHPHFVLPAPHVSPAAQVQRTQWGPLREPSWTHRVDVVRLAGKSDQLLARSRRSRRKLALISSL